MTSGDRNQQLAKETVVDFDEVRRMRVHIYRSNCRMRELIAILELREQTPTSKQLIEECRDVIEEGAEYE